MEVDPGRKCGHKNKTKQTKGGEPEDVDARKNILGGLFRSGRFTFVCLPSSNYKFPLILSHRGAAVRAFPVCPVCFLLLARYAKLICILISTFSAHFMKRDDFSMVVCFVGSFCVICRLMPHWEESCDVGGAQKRNRVKIVIFLAAVCRSK